MYTAFYPISLLYACVSFADAVFKVLEWCYTNVSGVSDFADIFQLHGSVIVFENSWNLCYVLTSGQWFQ